MEFYKETNFKETPIGKIPREWDIVKLEAVASVSAGGNAPQGEKYFRNGKYPFIRVQHFDGNKIYVDKWDLINDEAVKDYNLKLFPKNSIVFPKSGAAINLEKRAMLPFDSYVVNHLCVLVAKSEIIDSKFLFYIMKKTNLSRSSAGTTLPYLNLKTISKIPLPLPSLVEQRGIVEVLSVVDLAIQKTDEIIAKTERLKKGLMQTLLTKGIGHKEFKETPIGKIPKTWKVVKLGEVLTDVKYGTSVKSNKNGIGVPILGIPNVLRGEIDKSNLRYVKLSKKEQESLMLKSGDILLVRTNANPEYIGRCALFEEKRGAWVYASYLIRIRVDQEKVTPEYLVKYLQSEKARKQFLSIARTSAGNYNINTKGIKSIIACLPPIPEQQKIANILLTIDKKLKLERNKKAKLEKIKKGFMDLLLTGKVRVKVK